MLMFYTDSQEEAIKAYFKYGENTALAADALHFDSIMNVHFCDHTQNIMASHKSIAKYVFFTAGILKI